jgi:hypothetical protein
MQQDHATQRGGGNNAEKEMGMQMQTAIEMGEGRKGRGFIGREVREGPSTPVLGLFFLYHACVVKRTGTSHLKMGGRPGVWSLDGPFSFRSGKHSACY